MSCGELLLFLVTFRLPIQGRMFDVRSLLRYYAARYEHRTGSIFLDGLVGGMFLAFLLDTEDKCDAKEFVSIFFYIGLVHFLSKIFQDMSDYSSEVGERDGVETSVEKMIKKTFPFVLHVIRTIQFPLLFALTFYLVKMMANHEDWTHDRDEKEKNKALNFCEGNTMHIAAVTVVFQFLYGLLILLSWTVLWSIDREDDEAERLEEEKWKRDEAEMSSSVWGNIKEFVLVVGMESFFDGQVSSTYLALALALPHESCNIHVTEWFLMAGVVSTLTGVVNDLRNEVQQLSSLDGIVNRIEHMLIQFLRFVNFPLFLAEFVAYFQISVMVLENWADIDHSPEGAKLADGTASPHYCEKGTWKLMVAVLFIYVGVIVFRVVTVVGSLKSGDSVRKREVE
jgi:hypothetical protein